MKDVYSKLRRAGSNITPVAFDILQWRKAARCTTAMAAKNPSRYKRKGQGIFSLEGESNDIAAHAWRANLAGRDDQSPFPSLHILHL